MMVIADMKIESMFFDKKCAPTDIISVVDETMRLMMIGFSTVAFKEWGIMMDVS